MFSADLRNKATDPKKTTPSTPQPPRAKTVRPKSVHTKGASVAGSDDGALDADDDDETFVVVLKEQVTGHEVMAFVEYMVCRC